DQRFAHLVSTSVFYWLVPIILAVFAWKASPRPGWLWWVGLVGIVTAGMAILWLYRESRVSSGRYTLCFWFRCVTAIALIAVGLSGFSAAQGYRDPLGVQRYFKRTLQLWNANFQGQDLRAVNLNRADLREANLTNANLEDANLQDAHLKDAHLGN